MKVYKLVCAVAVGALSLVSAGTSSATTAPCTKYTDGSGYCSGNLAQYQQGGVAFLLNEWVSSGTPGSNLYLMGPSFSAISWSGNYTTPWGQLIAANGDANVTAYVSWDTSGQITFVQVMAY